MPSLSTRHVLQCTSDSTNGFITLFQFCVHELHSHSSSDDRPDQLGSAAIALGESGERKPDGEARLGSIGMLRMKDRRRDSKAGEVGKLISKLCET